MSEPSTDLGLNPGAVATYLNSVGWELSQDSDAGQTWVTPDSRRTSLIRLPKNPNFADYGDVFDDALTRLQRIYDWDIQELTTKILGARSDVLYIRASQSITDGTIPVREAQSLLDGAVEMVTAAARSAVSPRASYRGRMPDAVKDFVSDDLRMGHTQRGSFVITILARLDADPAGLRADAPEPGPTASSTEAWPIDRSRTPEIAPFQRRVMNSLATGLTFAREAADRARLQPGNGLDLDEAVSEGLSAELCSALNDMTTQQGVASLGLSFDWAASVPNRLDVGRAPTVFDRDTAAGLRVVRDRLVRQPPPDQRVEMQGYVTKLERGADSEEGVITVEGALNDNSRRRVRVSLTGKNYRFAVASHESRSMVHVQGTLRRESNVYWLRLPGLAISSAIAVEA